jgi:predicted transcriptional regulator
MTTKEISIEKSLDILGIKPSSKRVLLAITEHGTSAVADIASRLSMPKSSVYDSLDELSQKGLVTEYNSERGKSFGISEKDQLTRIHSEKIEELQSAHSSLISFIQNHSKADSVGRPKIKFYSGVQGIKQAFRDMPWDKKNEEGYLMWPLQDMLDTLGEEFLKWHAAPRFKNNIYINVIQKHEDMIIQKNKMKYDWLKVDYEGNLNRIRYAPKGTDWQMSYWIYGDKCLFASGGLEKFAFTIASKEFCQMMKLMWREMWNGAEELKS